MDWIEHHNDIAHWGLGRDASGPIEVWAVGFEYPEDRTVYDAAWQYEVICKYDDGVTTSISNKHPMGCKWIGADGWVYVDRGKIDASNKDWIRRDFDPAFSMEMPNPDFGLGHAFMRPAETLTDMQTPILPVLTNCYFAPQITASRSYQLGVAVREAAE